MRPGLLSLFLTLQGLDLSVRLGLGRLCLRLLERGLLLGLLRRQGLGFLGRRLELFLAHGRVTADRKEGRQAGREEGENEGRAGSTQ